jgi:hypothetical protein
VQGAVQTQHIPAIWITGTIDVELDNPGRGLWKPI